MTSRCARWPTRSLVCSTSSGSTISSPRLFTSRRVRATGVVTGQFYCLYLIAVTKFSDMGAYLTGSVIGRHQVIPHISPKKTWEGFFGALVFSLLASVGLFHLMPGHLSMLNLTHAIVLGLLLGFAAVIGDLAESIIKRSTGVKDSGQHVAGNWRRARPGRQPALHRAAAVFLSAARRCTVALTTCPMKRKRVVVLGATGSIGESALKVARDIPERMEIVGLAAKSNAKKLARTGERDPTRRCLPGR